MSHKSAVQAPGPHEEGPPLVGLQRSHASVQQLFSFGGEGKLKTHTSVFISHNSSEPTTAPKYLELIVSRYIERASIGKVSPNSEGEKDLLSVEGAKCVACSHDTSIHTRARA